VTLDRARRLYRRLLRLAPARLRDRHADAMEALFLERLEESGGIAAWVSAAWDILRARLAEPFRQHHALLPLPNERSTVMLGTDLRYTLRWLGRQRLSTLLVVSMLALGIAANVVVFSLVNGLFLRPFPVADPDRLVYVNETAPKWNLKVVGINYPDFDLWRRDAKLIEGIGIWDETSFNLSDGSGAERIEGARVTYDFPVVLGIRPLLGRLFTAEEDKPRAAAVVIIGDSLWRERFGGAGDVLGRTLRLNGVSHTIVGVVPAAAEFPARIRLWVPLAADTGQDGQSYGFNGAIARLKAGVSPEDAEKDLLRVQQAIWDARDKEHIVSPFAHPLRQEFSREFLTQARALLGAVAVLLIVACANVASVMLARALARRREMGIRLAVGASRVRLARQLFLENLALSILGGAAGLAVGQWALRVLIAAAGDQVPQWATFGFDWRVAGFTFAVTLVTALLFGWAPALHAIRGNLKGAMHEVSAGTTAGPGGRRTLALLVSAEFALAGLLIVCGGLLARAYDRVQHVDPGFRSDHVLTFTVALPRVTYVGPEGIPDDERWQKTLAFWDRLTERIGALPGVTNVGLVSCPPLGCHWGTFYLVEGRAPLKPGESNPVTLVRPATPGYFAAMGVRLERGRFFTDADGKDGNRSIIVNESFTKTFWPGVADPVGRRIGNNSQNPRWMTVVGMVADLKHYGLERPMIPGVYVPLRQWPNTTMAVAIRTSVDPESIAGPARAAVRELDPELAIYQVRTMEQALRRSLAERRLYSWLLGVFAVTALALALGGTYGVTSYLVSQRTREIGIRVALGARMVDIAAAVLRTSLLTVSGGIGIGIAASVAVTRQIKDLLFGVPSNDAIVLLSAAGVLITLAIAANWLPARRAARVDPMRSLRAE
jgi:putative ABC transport system permease protein